MGAARQMESLGRGLVAVNQGNGRVFVSWRWLGTEPDEAAFNLYRESAGAVTQLNSFPLSGATCFQDSGVNLSVSAVRYSRPVVKGIEQPAGGGFTLQAQAPPRPPLIPQHPTATPGLCTPPTTARRGIWTAAANTKSF